MIHAEFSQRIGLKPKEIPIQLNSMNDDLRIGLWNALYIHYFQHALREGVHHPFKNLQTSVLVHRIKHPVDEVIGPYDANRIIKNYFFNCDWFRAYEIVEYCSLHYSDSDGKKVNERFMSYCNNTLQNEGSGYRFVSGTLSPISSTEEIIELTNAMQSNFGSNGHQIHLEKALSFLSKKEKPDYPNSVKESISAVESICTQIVNNDKSTLGDALAMLEKKGIQIHPALKSAFGKIYGYTNDEDGVRHGMFDKENVKQEDARFMLISCSAFINYLIAKKAN